MQYKFRFLLLLAVVAVVLSCEKEKTFTTVPSVPEDQQPEEPEEEPRAAEFSPLHVEGRWFVNKEGVRRNLHGFAQTYSPWFNEQGSKWGNYEVDKCLNYNQGLIDNIIRQGWKMDFVRMHMDPYWSNKPGVQTTGENDISAFDFERFK